MQVQTKILFGCNTGGAWEALDFIRDYVGLDRCLKKNWHSGIALPAHIKTLEAGGIVESNLVEGWTAYCVRDVTTEIA